MNESALILSAFEN